MHPNLHPLEVNQRRVADHNELMPGFVFCPSHALSSATTGEKGKVQLQRFGSCDVVQCNWVSLPFRPGCVVSTIKRNHLNVWEALLQCVNCGTQTSNPKTLRLVHSRSLTRRGGRWRGFGVTAFPRHLPHLFSNSSEKLMKS